MWAAINMASRAGVDDLFKVEIDTVASIFAKGHNLISKSPRLSEWYTKKSESSRSGLGARALAAAFAAELRLRRSGCEPEPTRLNFFQEFPMIGLDEEDLKRLWVEKARLFVPDVLPKLSAEAAVRKHGDIASFVVWNTEAQERLLGEGFKVDLRAPWILDGLRPYSIGFRQMGDTVVVKSSGSGMPRWWRSDLLCQLTKFSINTPWSVHDPKIYASSRSREFNSNGGRVARLNRFYRALGANTRVLICYPTELIGVAAEMQNRGVQLGVLSLAPRGSHELENMRFGLEKGIILGQLDFGGEKNYFSLDTYRPDQIKDFIAKVKEGEAKEKGGLNYLGTEPIFSKMAKV